MDQRGFAASDKPDGRGDVSFHLEDGLLSLNTAKYFNRGLEITTKTGSGRHTVVVTAR